MPKKQPSGIILLIVIVGVAVLLAATFVLITVGRKQNLTKREAIRLENLRLISQAQEFYFDRFQKYGSFEELIKARLLDEIPRDNKNEKGYNLYRSTKEDEWCVWLEMEQQNPPYLSLGSHGQKKLIIPPIDLETCK